jgi:endonuclease/exonuclease/phosphatase family metal-dependent hydrolase
MVRKLSKIFTLAVGMFSALSTINTALAAAATTADIVKIATFNVLAPCWADPTYYPQNPDNVTAPFEYVTNSYTRATKLKAQVSQLKDSGVEVFAFQEITDQYFDAIANALGKEFTGFKAYHDISYWFSYQPDPANPVHNGNATFIKTTNWNVLNSNNNIASFPADGSGNHSVYTQIKAKRGSNRIYHVMNVHFDSDVGGNRKKELLGVMAILAPSFTSGNNTQIITGDFNCSTDHATIQQVFASNNFVNTINPLEPTHPFTTSYNGNPLYASIDHITVRNGKAGSGGTTIISNGLWQSYPVLVPNDTKEARRIVANFGMCGSDHFPVQGSVVP